MTMENLNQQVKDIAAPGVLEVIRWALMVHEDTMKQLVKEDHLAMIVGRYSLGEREEARKILLDYGAGKPARIMIHKGSKKEPICFNTVIASTQQRQLTEPSTIEAEFSE